jgi:hypothetical protein
MNDATVVARLMRSDVTLLLKNDDLELGESANEFQA